MHPKIDMWLDFLPIWNVIKSIFEIASPKTIMDFMSMVVEAESEAIAL